MIDAPFRIAVHGTPAVPLEAMRANVDVNAGVEVFGQQPLHARKLAVVGGGPLVVHDLDELRAWDGDIWGINDTAAWLMERGVKCTLFTIDAIQKPVNAVDLLAASWCSPELFAAFEGRTRAFHMAQTHADGIHGGAFTASSAPAVALKLGYTDVSLFGCEGSFEISSHVDRHESEASQLIVKAGGVTYLTIPRYLIQCDELCQMFRLSPVFKNRSRGLLKAIQDHPDTWTIVAVSAAFKKVLEEQNGKHGIYDEPYSMEKAA